MNTSDAFQYALRALSLRALTERELEKKLKQRKVSAGAISEIIERLRDYGFLNDAGIAARAPKTPVWAVMVCAKNWCLEVFLNI